MSSRRTKESFCFVHTTQYDYEEDNKSALERLGLQGTYKFQSLWSVRDGKGLIQTNQKQSALLIKLSTIYCLSQCKYQTQCTE